MRTKVKIFENNEELRKWDQEKELNEDLGIKRPEEIETWSTLYFDLSCLESVFIQADGNLCMLFKSGESFIGKSTPEILDVIEAHFGL